EQVGEAGVEVSLGDRTQVTRFLSEQDPALMGFVCASVVADAIVEAAERNVGDAFYGLVPELAAQPQGFGCQLDSFVESVEPAEYMCNGRAAPCLTAMVRKRAEGLERTKQMRGGRLQASVLHFGNGVVVF